MTAPRVCWWWVESRLIRFTGLHGGGEGVVDFEDGAFGVVVAVELGLVLALHDGEGLHILFSTCRTPCFRRILRHNRLVETL